MVKEMTFIWLLVPLLLAGCATYGTARTPVSYPIPRPALAAPELLPQDWRNWLESLVKAQEENCIRLEVLRGTSGSAALNQCTIK